MLFSRPSAPVLRITRDLFRRETVTSEVCDALARMGSVSQLATALRHPRAHVRQCAAYALKTTYLEGEAAVPALVSALVLADPDDGVRRAASGALGSLLRGPEARVDALLDAIREQRSRLVRDALREIASGKDELAVLLHRIKSDSAPVRRAAAIALTEIIPPQEAGIRRFCLWAVGLAILTLRKIAHH